MSGGLSDEDNAEKMCNEFVAEAMKANPEDPETLTTLANFKLCQRKPEEAVKAALAAARILRELDDDELPPYGSRVTCAKILLEIEQYQEASEVFEQVLREDDSDMELWYLTAEAYAGAGDLGTAEAYAKRALEVC